MKMIKDNQFVLCCRGKKCPIVTISDDCVEISDDYEQKVKMTKEQFMEIGKVVAKLEEKS